MGRRRSIGREVIQAWIVVVVIRLCSRMPSCQSIACQKIRDEAFLLNRQYVMSNTSGEVEAQFPAVSIHSN